MTYIRPFSCTIIRAALWCSKVVDVVVFSNTSQTRICLSLISSLIAKPKPGCKNKRWFRKCFKNLPVVSTLLCFLRRSTWLNLVMFSCFRKWHELCFIRTQLVPTNYSIFVKIKIIFSFLFKLLNHFCNILCILVCHT